MLMENSGTMKRIVFSCADVHKSLLSVSRLRIKGADAPSERLVEFFATPIREISFHFTGATIST